MLHNVGEMSHLMSATASLNRIKRHCTPPLARVEDVINQVAAPAPTRRVLEPAQMDVQYGLATRQ